MKTNWGPFLLSLLSIFLPLSGSDAQDVRPVTGRVITPRFEAVRAARIEIDTPTEKHESVSDEDGHFSIRVSGEVRSLRVYGDNIVETTMRFGPGESTQRLIVKINYIVPPIAETVTIQAGSLEPSVEFRNGAIYTDSLFNRDDQLIQTLNAGINAGQHEGGGKSLEIRRYGFNLDHGGVNGGLKILVDNVQQNQGTQGHGQGYLGSLKTLTPELVEDVSIINGPFSAAYGDFSGLGVVQIRQREDLPQIFTARMQGGSFNTFRGFFAFSPEWKNVSSFIAYEPSYTDGPFDSPLRYRRYNVTGNFTFNLSDKKAIGFKFNAGTNDFFSSGQIPLDLVASGELDRFGFLDPENGGRGQAGTLAGYYRREFTDGSVLRADAFVGRSLFDLYSNFTFFLTDQIYGDEIQQHDSRLQQGGNIQMLRPYKAFGLPSLITVGFNILANQVNVGLYPTASRAPNRKFLSGNQDNPDVLLTSAKARINNYAGYLQNETNLLDGRLRIDAGLRIDYFRYNVAGFELRDEQVNIFAKQGKSELQPKLAIAFSPLKRTPITFYANYGRGVLSQDARGVAREPDGPKLATTDFYQAGASFNSPRFSAVVSSFLIDRSSEQVYIPDDGSVELAGPSRSYGIEARTTVAITRRIGFNGGATKVLKAYFPGEFTEDGRRIIVDSAPRFVANAGLVLSDIGGFSAAINWRHISRYRLDGEDPSITASGNDVVDLAVSRPLTKWMKVNLAIDNLLNKRYFETQNFFDSRTCQLCGVASRIHATPGYPFSISLGVTLTIGRKN